MPASAPEVCINTVEPWGDVEVIVHGRARVRRAVEYLDDLARAGRLPGETEVVPYSTVRVPGPVAIALLQELAQVEPDLPGLPDPSEVAAVRADDLYEVFVSEC